VSLRAGGGKSISLQSVGETVLENLVRIAETTGQHFIESPNPRQVLWLRNDVRDSGMRAVADIDPVAVENHPEICLIASLTEVATGVNLCSRVQPYGGGTGTERATLRDTTRVAPAGYTLDKVNNWLIRDAAESSFGRIERMLTFADVSNVSSDVNGMVHAANMVFDRALTYLRRNSATNLTLDDGDMPRTYELQLVKCDRALLPGHTLRVQYSRFVEGNRRIHVDADLWIISSTVRVDEAGLRTVALQCSTVDVAPLTDAMLLAQMLRQQRAMQAYGANT
jgi:hypothetical protein